MRLLSIIVFLALLGESYPTLGSASFSEMGHHQRKGKRSKKLELLSSPVAREKILEEREQKLHQRERALELKKARAIKPSPSDSLIIATSADFALLSLDSNEPGLYLSESDSFESESDSSEFSNCPPNSQASLSQEEDSSWQTSDDRELEHAVLAAKYRLRRLNGRSPNLQKFPLKETGRRKAEICRRLLKGRGMDD